MFSRVKPTEVSSSSKSALPRETLVLSGPSKGADGVEPVLPEYSWEEIMKHDKIRDLWLVVGGNIYNVGEFMSHHPGGPEIMKANHGRDATAAFLAVGHPPYALALTKSFLIGRVKASAAAPTNRAVARSMSKVAPLTTEALKEVPVAVEKLQVQGQRWLNYPILNDITSQLDFFARFGHIYQVRLPGNHGRIVMVSDPELLDDVADNTEQFGKKVEGINFFTQLQLARGGGISVISDSDEYQKIRRIMLPWYSPKQQRTQLEVMKDVARRLLVAWSALPDDQPLEMRDWLTRYSLEVSGRGACQYNLGTMEAPTMGACPFGATVVECLREAIARVAEAAPDHYSSWRASEKRTKSRKFHKQSQLLFTTGTQIVDVRSHMHPVGDQVDLLSRLLTEPDPETGTHLDAGTVRDQMLMHLSNGFNGPSVTLAWLVAELAKRPDIEAKVIAEIDEITKGDPEYNLEYVDLLTMPYITQVIKEALRVYPPLPVTVRNSLKDGVLGPFRMLKDDIILVGALAAHHDRRFWGDQPAVFDPDHFTPDKIARRHRLAFIPFSVGQRQCMAQEVTFMMLRIVIFHIYNKYRLRMAPGATVTRRPIVSNTPVSVKVVRQPREGKAERIAALKAAAEARAAAEAASAPKSATSGSAAASTEWDVPSAIPVISAHQHIVFAFGSNFGSCRRLAELLAQRSRRYGFTNEVMPLDRITELPEQLKPWLLVVCTATYTGNPPSNAALFKAWLDKTPKATKTWSHCKYLVLGLGNTQWNAYLRFPTYVQNRLTQLGATALAILGSADVGNKNWENDFQSWQQMIWPVLIDLARAKPSETAALMLMMEEAKTKAATSNDNVGKEQPDGSILAPTMLTNGVGTGTQPGRIRLVRQLCANGATTAACHIEIELPQGAQYSVGDHLGVCPENDAFVVARVAEHLGVELDGVFRLPAHAHMSASSLVPGTVLQVRNILTQALDLSGPIPVELVTAMLAAAQDKTDQTRLTELKAVLTTGDSRASPRLGALVDQRVGILGVLEAFPQVRLDFIPFLQTLRPLKPRYYSISSSPMAHGATTAHITVGLLAEPLAIAGDKGAERVFHGLSSSYLHGVREDTRLNVFVSLAAGFHLHKDIAKPTIMVSAGTGFAPMRAFLHELQQLRCSAGAGATKPVVGEVALFNGIRREQEDYIYKEELLQFVQNGVLQHLHVAKSRADARKREYVQHKIIEQAALINRLLDAGAYVYVCGSDRMRADVRAAFVQVMATTKRGAEAEDYMAMLETRERYNPDIWG